MAFLDSTDFCYYTFVGGNWPLFVKLVNGLYGVGCDDKDLIAIGQNAIREEIAFNRKAGINEELDQLPEFLEKEPLMPTSTVFDVSKNDLKSAMTKLAN